jgi:hypothetical protein
MLFDAGIIVMKSEWGFYSDICRSSVGFRKDPVTEVDFPELNLC